MKNIITILINLFLIKGALFSQNLDSLLKSVEEKNPRLIALQKWLEVENAQAKTGIYPDNPEISYNYLFGSPEDIGDQQEFEIIQSFKLPGYYTSKSALQKVEYEQKKILALKEKKEVVYNMYSSYFNIVWLIKKENLIKKKKEESERLVSLMKEGFNRGEVSKPLYNQSRIYNIKIQNEWQKIKTDIQIEREQLKQLNGGDSINNLIFEYPENWQLPLLDSLMAKLPEQNPDLQIAELGIKKNEESLKHQRLNNLPTFEIGYKSERILDQSLRGIHAGITIPLWQNSKRIKSARLQVELSQVELNQKKSELKSEILSLYNNSLNLYKNYRQIKELIEEEELSGSNLQLLESGQISFHEYLTEANLITGLMETYILAEKDYYIGILDLKMFFEN